MSLFSRAWLAVGVLGFAGAFNFLTRTTYQTIKPLNHANL